MENKDEPPFAYVGPTIDFNNVDIEHSKMYILWQLY